MRIANAPPLDSLRAVELFDCTLPGITKLRSGKVREVFDLGEHLLFVATDRISAFDCILPTPIPDKGRVLSMLSEFWFEKFDFVENHRVASSFTQFPASLQPFRELLEGRSMIVQKATPLPVECVVRGYLAGSGWKDYKATGAIGGIELPKGLELSAKLDEPIFTPSTKAEKGHDETISWDQCRNILGDDLALQVRKLSLEIYDHGRAYAASRGIIIADTKFEFGLKDGKLLLIDECLTPDSSRFWPEEGWRLGINPPSFDKQFVRDYLETLQWEKTPPAPPLPASIIQKTREKYLEAHLKLTGRSLV